MVRHMQDVFKCEAGTGREIPVGEGWKALEHACVCPIWFNEGGKDVRRLVAASDSARNHVRPSSTAYICRLAAASGFASVTPGRLSSAAYILRLAHVTCPADPLSRLS
jgi:hypothetical protein